MEVVHTKFLWRGKESEKREGADTEGRHLSIFSEVYLLKDDLKQG